MGIGPLRSRALRGLLLISAVAFFGCGDGTPPEIQITSPAPGAVVKSGEPAAISFEVHDEGSSYLVFSKRSGLAHATVVAETEAGEVEFSAEVTSEGTHTLSWTPGGSEKYWIRVSAVDKSDNYAQESAAVVNHVEVVANFVVTPASGIPPLVVTVQDESANATSWEWDFGDGSDIVEQQSPPQHTYEEAGRYTIKLVVKGVGERSDELTQIVDVSYPTGASEYAQYATVPVTSPAPQGPVPPRYDLSKYLPPVRSQGQQGSCTAWAVGYYLKGFQEAHERGWDASSEDHQFSPAFVYNQITLGSCTGTSVPANMTILSDMGVCAWRTMPYTDQECSRQPSAGAKSEAADYRIRDFTRINFHDPTNVKGYVAGEERPVVLVIKIDSAFDRLRGDDVFHEFIGGREGLHAVLLVGYDDGKQAYKIVNSWGDDWGDDGFGWIDYSFFTTACLEAYVSTDRIELVESRLNAVPTSGSAPLTVQFQDDSEGAVSWLWTFGDGVESVEENPRHTYDSPGTYRATLQITSADDATDTESLAITVHVPPVAAFSRSPSAGPAPLTVQFTNQSQGADAYSWQFGDGETSPSRHPVHTYDRPGTFPVTLTITGPGGVDDETHSITVQTVVSSSFSASHVRGQLPLTVEFTNRSTGATAYSWMFGDGSTSTSGATTVTHTYTTAGSHEVNLEATGPGGKDTSSATVIVIGPELPVAAFSASPTSGLAPLTVTFTNRSTDATSYVWDFGDGDGSTSSAATVEHTYEQADSYKVTLSATGPGGTAAATETIAVVNPDLPVAAFRASPVDGALPLVVRFDNESTGADAYSWTFGDGGVSTEESPEYTYRSPGDYEVTLAVTGPGGAASETKPGFIHITRGDDPVAAFSADTGTGYGTHTVAFSNESQNATSYLWDFGDGTTSREDNPAHEYVTHGVYTVTLTAEGPGGSAVERKVDLIRVLEVVVTVAEIEDDTYIRAKRADDNYGDQPQIQVEDSSDEDWGLIWFDAAHIPQVPAGNILSATLYMHGVQTGGTSVGWDTFVLNVDPVRDVWREHQVTWDTRPAVIRGFNTDTRIGLGQGNFPIEIDLTNVVQAWRNGELSDWQGFALRVGLPAGRGSASVVIRSKEAATVSEPAPRVVIRWVP